MYKLSLCILMSVVLFGVISANADTRIEVMDDFCHVPWDAANTDNESFISGCGGVVRTFGALANGFARVVYEEIPVRILPPDSNPEDIDQYPGGNAATVVTDENSGDICVLVDSNNEIYVSQSWTARTRAWRGPNRYLGRVEYYIECWNAVQQQQQQ